MINKKHQYIVRNKCKYNNNKMNNNNNNNGIFINLRKNYNKYLLSMIKVVIIIIMIIQYMVKILLLGLL